MKRKTKKLFSALVALAMLFSLCTFASADNDVTFAAGADSGGYFSAVAGLSNAPTAAKALSQATIPYTFVGDDYALTAGAVSVSGWTATLVEDSGYATLTITKGAVSVEFDLTVADDADIPNEVFDNGGTITLGRATGGDGDSVGSGGSVTSGDGTFNDYASDTANGRVTSEGEVPDEVINVLVPTSNMTKNAFDLYLDPHDLLKATSGARYATVDSGGNTVNPTLTGDKRVYFKTGDATFSNESSEMTITNKSSVPISVDLTVAVTKPTTGNMKFVATEAALENETGAAIYLAVKSGSDVGAVSDTAGDDGANIGTLATSVQSGDWYELVWHTAEGQSDPTVGSYTRDMKASVASGDPEDFEQITFQLTSAINSSDDWDAITTFPLSVTWDVKEYEEAEAGGEGGGENDTPAQEPVVEAVDPTATVDTAFTAVGSTLTINLTWGAGAGAKTHAALTTSNSAVDTTVDAPATTLTATAPTGAAAYRNLQSAATVTFYNTSADEADAVTVNVTIK